mgnify:FL=1|jgi:hypothetical protein|tara:strand:+ start:332 stop:523 length:192 start_codon:yes stop_codon:yes gene_type:complete
MEERQLFLNMLQLIDVSSKRGAWGGNELEVVALTRKAVVEKLISLEESVEENVDSLQDADKEE